MKTRFVLLPAAISLCIGLVPVGHAQARPSETCTPAVRTASPVGTTPCSGARPGALIEIPSSSNLCTLGFLFRDARKRRYMTTSGHCVLSAEGKKKWGPTSGPAVLDSGGNRIGRFVFAAMKGELDIGFIAIDPKVRASAQVCHFGGPTGLNDERRNDLAVLEFYGHGIAIGDVLPARSGFARNTRDPGFVYAWGPAGLGDSGGPWLTEDGRALGYITHLLGFGAGADVSPVLVRRLAPQVSAASKALRTTLRLQKAARLP